MKPRFLIVSEDFYIAIDKIVSFSKQAKMIVIETVHYGDPTTLNYETTEECQRVFDIYLEILR
jgi:hypothetical protein